MVVVFKCDVDCKDDDGVEIDSAELWYRVVRFYFCAAVKSIFRINKIKRVSRKKLYIYIYIPKGTKKDRNHHQSA